MGDPGQLVGGVWLPTLETHLVENMTRGSKKAMRDGKLTYQTHKLDVAMRYQPEDRRRVCVDAGAHVGLWSMWLVKLFKHVHAFEPLVELHQDIFHKNVPAENVTFHPYALGSRSDTVRMKTRPRASCTSFITRDGLTKEEASQKVGPNVRSEKEHTMSFDNHDAEMRTLDSFELEDVDFIKIDTEGFEIFVITGGLETIKRCKPNMVVEQSGVGAYYGQQPNASIKLLEGMGMVCRAKMGPDHIMVWK